MSDPLDELPAAVALEIDALCDDFERHWRRARRRGEAVPGVEAFLNRASSAAGATLLRCLRDLEHELRTGVALPEIPGLRAEERCRDGASARISDSRSTTGDSGTTGVTGSLRRASSARRMSIRPWSSRRT